MTGFRSKTIATALSLGEQLMQARQQLSLSLAVAAQQTKISAHYLAALEDGRYAELPGEVYARSFLKVYSQWLGLDADRLLTDYQKEYTIFNKVEPKSTQRNIKKPVEKVSQMKLWVTPKLIRHAAIISLALACLVYLGFKVQAIFSPPTLVITAPTHDIITDQTLLTVTGQSEAETVVRINEQQVLTDEQGNFTESLILQRGTNIINISAQTKHGVTTQVVRTVVVTGEGS